MCSLLLQLETHVSGYIQSFWAANLHCVLLGSIFIAFHNLFLPTTFSSVLRPTMIFVKQGQSYVDSPQPEEKFFTDAEALDINDSDPAIDPSTGQHKLVRQLKNRHVSMIRCVAFPSTLSLNIY